MLRRLKPPRNDVDVDYIVIASEAKQSHSFMIQPEEIHKILSNELPSAEITVQDLTGSRDHYQVMIVWDGFKGKSLVEQHQVINKILNPALEDGRIHALSIKTFTPQKS